MYSSEILMCINVLLYLLGMYYQLLQTQFKLLFTNLWKKATLNNLTIKKKNSEGTAQIGAGI
jgi:hypothetical protein